MVDIITAKQSAEWKLDSAFEAAKNRGVPDPIERRLQHMEGALIDMGCKLSRANEAYAQCWKRLQLFEQLLQSWEKRFLTAEEHALMLDCIKIIKGD